MFLCTTFPSVHAQEAMEKAQIAILGTFHFSSTSDLLAMDPGDLTTPERQQQLQEVIDALKKFGPTKILIEYPYGNNKIDSVYQKYLSGDHALTINERQQLGFRLAEQLGHAHIYPTDHRANLPFDELMKFLESTHQMDSFNALIALMQTEVMTPMQEYYDNHDLKSFFIYMNGEDMDRWNRNSYLEYLSKYVSDDTNIGVQIATDWWGRNFQIMSNIDRTIEPGDKVLVLFGQGHTALLKEFYKDRTDVKYVDIVGLLE